MEKPDDLEGIPRSTSPQMFSLTTLELSFNLLRTDYAGLSLQLQNIIVTAKQQGINTYDECLVELTLSAEEVSSIVTSLSEIGEKAAMHESYGKEDMIAIHGVILDWLLYAQSFMDDITVIGESTDE